MGYVERLRSNDDRRVVNVVITKKGREQFEVIRKLRSDRVRSILEQLGPNDVDEFLRIVNRIVEIVESESDGKR
jgi:MarR family transcriptional regulator, 2-MHQ and catechol-resistance regulon repressor